MIASVPVDLARDEAARLAREELAKHLYRDAGPSLAERVVRALIGQAARLLGDVAGVSPGGYAGLVAVLLLVLTLVVAFRLTVGPLGGRAATSQTLFTGRPRTSAEHRAAADGHAAAGRWAEAVRERLRAVVRLLEERAVLDERPGRTADEAATEAGRMLPGCADELRRAARLFDDVWYGGRPAGPSSDAAVRALDERVRAARPARAPAGRP